MTNAADVTAEITSAGSVTSAGAVGVSATGHNSAAAESNGGSVGGISISVMIPSATIAGGVLADANGTVQGGSLDVTAAGENVGERDHPGGLHRYRRGGRGLTRRPRSRPTR